MSKGLVVHLENEKDALAANQDLFLGNKLDLEYVPCSTEEEFHAIVSARASEVKVLIFDLLGDNPSNEELNEGISKAYKEEIEEKFDNFRVPIFVYSGKLQNFNDFKYKGTVFKIDKGGNGFNVIRDKIRLFLESGFLDVFCYNGKLENILIDDLHEAFINQFDNHSDIENIIQSTNVSGKFDQERTQNIFIRIAIRSLLSKLLVPDPQASLPFTMLNGVEHYHKRLSNYEFWTGDILKHNNSENYLLVITPRCNVASKSYDQLLVCELVLGEFPKKIQSGKDIANVKDYLTGNPNVSVYERYVPPSPIFKGGKVVLSKYQMIPKQNLRDNYKVVISLSDELTNEMLGKFGAYFFRTGITPWSPDEVINYIKATA